MERPPQPSKEQMASLSLDRLAARRRIQEAMAGAPRLPTPNRATRRKAAKILRGWTGEGRPVGFT